MWNLFRSNANFIFFQKSENFFLPVYATFEDKIYRSNFIYISIRQFFLLSLFSNRIDFFKNLKTSLHEESYVSLKIYFDPMLILFIFFHQRSENFSFYCHHFPIVSIFPKIWKSFSLPFYHSESYVSSTWNLFRSNANFIFFQKSENFFLLVYTSFEDKIYRSNVNFIYFFSLKIR